MRCQWTSKKQKESPGKAGSSSPHVWQDVHCPGFLEMQLGKVGGAVGLSRIPWGH
jgi:hypothetical protein